MSSTRTWLNGLTQGERSALALLMCDSVGFTFTSQITGGSIVNLAPISGNAPRSGNWYKEWVKCKVIRLDLEGGHPRWQPRIKNKEGVTPTSHTALGRLIKKRLTKESWSALKVIAGSKGQLKLPCHHLAYLAAKSGSQIPDDMGSGSSLSHLCDVKGCIRGEHLELTTEHVDNLVRQRCHGVTLLVAYDFILHEIPCGHASGDTLLEKVESSCRKLRVVNIPDSSLNELMATMQALADVGTITPQASQSQQQHQPG